MVFQHSNMRHPELRNVSPYPPPRGEGDLFPARRCGGLAAAPPRQSCFSALGRRAESGAASEVASERRVSSNLKFERPHVRIPNPPRRPIPAVPVGLVPIVALLYNSQAPLNRICDMASDAAIHIHYAAARTAAAHTDAGAAQRL